MLGCSFNLLRLFSFVCREIRWIELCALQILGFSVPSIILADLLENKCLLARVQKVMVCDSGLVDLYPFCVFRVLRFVAL